MRRFIEMNGARFILAGLLLGMTLSAGCAGKQKTDDLYPVQITRQADIPAGATSYGHPFRLAAFVLHPVGVLLDYVVVRPIYYVASLAPTLFGYTAEDDAAFEKARKSD